MDNLNEEGHRVRQRNRGLWLILSCVFIALVVFSGSGCQTETTSPQATPTASPTVLPQTSPTASPAPMGVTGNCQAY
ncbi:MAG: hypothetical protein HPY68_09495 [Candidatus Atribacteria bacterium]|nr:hypothetical protein [Candidatus Atribacteria bacterium]